MPHIAVVEAIRGQNPETKFLYVGSKSGPEKKYAQKYKIPFKTIPTGKLRRYFSLKNAIDAVKIPLGILKSIFIIIGFRPDVIFSKGGYPAVPVIIAGWLLRTPIIAHDSDAKPGLTTKIAARFAKKILLGYPEAEKFFDKKKTFITGIPIRKEIFKGGKKEGLDLTGFTATKPTILVMGGSLGSENINQAIAESLPEIVKFTQVIHVTGRGKQKNIPTKTKGHLGQYKVFEYVDEELPHLYAISDLVVGRAGANSLAEIQALKKPSILIPLGPPVSHGDQLANAKVLLKREGCVVIENQKLTSAELTEAIKTILKNHALLKKMSRKAYHPFNPKAAASIAKILLAVAEKK